MSRTITVDRANVSSPQKPQQRALWLATSQFLVGTSIPQLVLLVRVGQNFLYHGRGCVWGQKSEKIIVLAARTLGLDVRRGDLGSCLHSCVVLGKLLIIFAHQFPHRPNGANNKTLEHNKTKKQKTKNKTKQNRP